MFALSDTLHLSPCGSNETINLILDGLVTDLAFRSCYKQHNIIQNYD